MLCSLANLAQGLSFSLFLHFPGFLNEIGASDVQIGFLFGLTGVAAILARPPIGRFMDTRGRRGVILLGNALNVAVLGLYTTVDAVGPLVFGIRIVHGLGEAMVFTASGKTSCRTYFSKFSRASGSNSSGVRSTKSLSMNAMYSSRGVLPMAWRSM